MTTTVKARLAVEIFASYVAARWYLRQTTLPSVLARLRQVDGRRADLPLPADQGSRLGHAVGRTLARIPGDSRCLVRSLVLVRLLARRGVASALVIAACPQTEADDFTAHAWVEVSGRPVLPPGGPGYGRLISL